MKTIHMNSHALRRNNSLPEGKKEPVFEITDQDEKHMYRSFGNEVLINGPSKLVHSPMDPLPRGARVWIEVEDDVEIVLDGIVL